MTTDVLSASMIDVVQSYPGSYITAVKDGHIPVLTRVVGLRVDDPESVTVAIQTPISDEFLACVAQNPRVALVGVKVTTYLTFQFKGNVVATWEATEEDCALIQDYVDGFSALVAHVGLDPVRYGPAFSEGPWTCLRMQIDQVFDQTPRVGAGNLIKSREGT